MRPIGWFYRGDILAEALNVYGSVRYRTVQYLHRTAPTRRTVEYRYRTVRYGTVLYSIILAPLDMDWVFGHVDVYEICDTNNGTLVQYIKPYRTVL